MNKLKPTITSDTIALVAATHDVGHNEKASNPPVDFVSLNKESRTHVSTTVMCHHLGRKEQTARGWACHEDGPLSPIRVNGRLAWAVADIRRILGVA